MRLFKQYPPEERRKRAKRRVIVYGTLIAAIVGFYFYQPQRINFFPAKPLQPNPMLDPDSSALFSKGVKIALIQAHPDDSEFFLGPLLLRLKASGAEIHQLVMTDGDKSFYFWQHEDPAENRRAREAEQREAASHYAVDVTFFHKPDGRLAGQSDNTELVRKFLEDVKPDYVIAFDPVYWPRVNHADHLASGRAAVDAVSEMDSKDKPKWLLLYDSSAHNYTADVTKTVDEGAAMLAIHKSQFAGERLKRITDFRMATWYEDGQAANESYGIALRAVKVKQ